MKDEENAVQFPAASFPMPTMKVGQQQQQGHVVAAGAPWFPGASAHGSNNMGNLGMGYGEPLYGGNWVPPQMLDSMQDSLLRPPAA